MFGPKVSRLMPIAGAEPVAAAEGCDRLRRRRQVLSTLKAFGLIAACGSGYKESCRGGAYLKPSWRQAS